MSMSQEHQERAARAARDFWITFALIVSATTGLVWHFANRPARIADDPCPTIDQRLNAYERELQERECEALRRVRR